MPKEIGQAISNNALHAAKNVCQLVDYFGTRQEEFWGEASILLDELEQNKQQIPKENHQWVLHLRLLQLSQAIELYDNRDLSQLRRVPEEVLDAVRIVNQELRMPLAMQRDKNPPESPQQMTKQGVPDTQICRAWGLLDENNREQLDLLEKELKEPGSVLSETYVHPDLKKHDAAIGYLWTKYREMLNNTTDAVDPVPPSCPETPEELFVTDVPAEQAARMLGMDLAKVQAMWQKFTEEYGEKPQDKTFYKNKFPQPVYDGPVHGKTPEISPLYSESDADDEDEPLEDGAVPFNTQTARHNLMGVDVDDLREMAKEMGVTIKGNLGADKLIDRIVEHQKRAASKRESAND